MRNCIFRVDTATGAPPSIRDYHAHRKQNAPFGDFSTIPPPEQTSSLRQARHANRPIYAHDAKARLAIFRVMPTTQSPLKRESRFIHDGAEIVSSRLRGLGRR